jgi:ubiquitin C-terminal hydrolase
MWITKKTFKLIINLNCFGKIVMYQNYIATYCIVLKQDNVNNTTIVSLTYQNCIYNKFKIYYIWAVIAVIGS